MKKSLFAFLGIAVAAAGVVAATINPAEVFTSAAGSASDYVYSDFVQNSYFEENYSGWARNTDTVFNSDIGGVSLKASSLFRSGANDRVFLGNTEDNIDNLGARVDDDENYAKIIAAAEGTELTHNISILYTTDYVENFKNLHIEFSSEVGHVAILFRNYGEDAWSLAKSSGGDAAFPVSAGTIDTEGVWSAGYQSFNWTIGSAFEASKTQIAFLHRSYGAAAGHSLIIKKFVVNVDRAAVGYMNYLANKTWCGTAPTTALDATKLDYFNAKLTTAQLEALKGEAVSGELSAVTNRTNYYDLLTLVFGEAGKTLTNALPSNFFNAKNSTGDSAVIVISVLATASLLTVILVLKKKRTVTK